MRYFGGDNHEVFWLWQPCTTGSIVNFVRTSERRESCCVRYYIELITLSYELHLHLCLRRYSYLESLYCTFCTCAVAPYIWQDLTTNKRVYFQEMNLFCYHTKIVTTRAKCWAGEYWSDSDISKRSQSAYLPRWTSNLISRCGISRSRWPPTWLE